MIAALDGVRAVAILAVLAHHGSYGIARGGFLGVDLFFVLSGFLITHLLVREWGRHGRISLAGFYARRALRILPPLVAALALAQLLGRFDWRTGALPILGFYANYVPHLDLGSMIHAWSLAVEEQFYFAWPLLFVGAMRLGGVRAAAAVALLVLLASLLLRIRGHAAGAEQEFIYRHVLYRADALAAGCLVALLDRSRWRLPTSAILYGFLAAFGLLCFVASSSHWLALTAGFTIFALMSAVFIAALVDAAPAHPVARLLSCRLARWIGRRSYGIYLYHVPIFVALEAWREKGSLINFVLVTLARLLLTAAVAEVSWRLIEQPALSLKRFFYPGAARSGRPVAGPGPVVGKPLA